MRNHLSVSLGYAYKFLDTASPEFMNNAISLINGLPIDGVEFSFHKKNRLYNFNVSNGLSSDNSSFVKKLSHNSIHAPDDFIFGSDKESSEVLEKIESVNKSFKTRQVIFHEYHISDFEVLLSYDFVACIENNGLGRKCFKDPLSIRGLLDKHDLLFFAFDFAHALQVNPLYIPDFLSDFCDKMLEVHFSLINNKEHSLYHLNPVNEDLVSLMKDSLFPDVSIVSEAVLNNNLELPLLKKEIEYLKNV